MFKTQTWYTPSGRMSLRILKRKYSDTYVIERADGPLGTLYGQFVFRPVPGLTFIQERRAREVWKLLCKQTNRKFHNLQGRNQS